MKSSKILFILIIKLCLIFSVFSQHYKDDRNTMVHLFEWKFDDIAEECERFLGPMGYGGVQVSPINENLIIKGRPWYERYQPLSYKLISRSGDKILFENMVKRCNAANVRIFVDIVINHMTGDFSPAIGTAGSTATTNVKSYPAVPFSAQDFHSTCAINNYKNATEVRNCELSGLHDLNQTNTHVRHEIVKFMNNILDLGVAGFRVDAAKHMWPEDLKVIYGKLKNLSVAHGFVSGLRPFIYQEVIDLGGEAVNKREYTSLGRVIEFTYGVVLGNIFRGNEPFNQLKNWGNGWGLLASNEALVMIDNHDNQRGHGAGGAAILTYKQPKEYKMAIAFELAHPYGTTRIMSSYYFDDPSIGPPAYSNGTIISPRIDTNGQCKNGWVCEHRWHVIYQMVFFRIIVKNAPVENWWDNGNKQIAFSRGNRGFIAINGEKNDLKQNLYTGLSSGRYCDVITGEVKNNKCTGKLVEVKSNGTALIEILSNANDTILAIHIGNQSLLK